MADPDLYPPVGFHFKVEFQIQGLTGEEREVRFQEATGFSKEIGTEEFKEGGENRFSYKFPTPAKYNNLVLKRGLLTNSKIIDWCFKAMDNFIFEPAEIIVSLYNEEHNAIVTWNFTGAYPVKWNTSDLKAQENAIVVETMEIAYQYFTKKDVA